VETVTVIWQPWKVASGTLSLIPAATYIPRIVGYSAQLLAQAVDLYVFISTISVYADFSQPGLNEVSPLAILDDDSVEEVNGETYGPLKALCERAAEEALPGRVLAIRPGLIVGPYDPTDRFSYWPHRISQGGEILAPGQPIAPVQFIDGRDLAEWIIHAIETWRTGIFNATGPESQLTFGQTLSICQQTIGAEAIFTWVDEDYLVEANVESWTDLPLWIAGPEHVGLMAVSVDKAVSAGLTFRLLAKTVRDTLEWTQNRANDYEWRAGLEPDREQKLLTGWHGRS
jgi:2'-hydroxyisoflavone reductase